MTDGWLSGGYLYRQKHLITSGAGSGTNYQIKINVHSGAGASSGDDVYLKGHCQHFPNDIDLAYDVAGTATELKFWIEDPTADPLVLWVKVAADLTSNANIYIYYGSSRTTSLADGTNTFVLFDHFLGTTLDTTTNWNAAGTGSNAVSGSILTITSDTGAGNGYYVSSKATYTGGYAVEMRAAQAGDATHSVFEWAGFVITAGSSSLASCTYCFRLNQADTYFTYAVYNAVPAGTIGNYSTAKDTNYHRCSARRSGANPDTCVLDGDSHTVNDAVNTAYYVTMEAYCNAAGYSGVIKIDWIAVRKYTATEPANSTWYTEESPAISGVTRDNTGAVLVSCTVYLFRTSDLAYIGTVTSNAITGAYTFQVGDPTITYFVVAFKSGAPDVQGVTDKTLVGA